MTLRTDHQNAALHLYFRWLAEALGNEHFDFRDLRIEIPATENLVKELIWKPVSDAMYGKKSTKTLEISEVSAIYDTLNRELGERLGVHVPFPNKQDLENERQRKQNSHEPG